MRAERLCALALCLLGCLAPRASALRITTTVPALSTWPVNGQIEVAGVTVAVRSPWPDMLDHGALPLLVDVSNGAKSSRDLEVVFTNGFGSRTTRLVKRISLEPGERGSFEVFVPVNSYAASDYALDVRTGGERDRLPGLGATKPPDPGVRNVLVVAEGQPRVGAADFWTNDLSGEATPRWTVPPQPLPSAVGARRISTLGYGSRPVGTPPAHVVIASFVPFADLPSRPEPYASIDAVVIDPVDGLPSPDEAAAIGAFARTGGVVALFGRGADRVARSSIDFEPWLEARFRLHGHDGVDTYLCGQGLLLVSESDAPLDTSAQIAELNEAMEAHGGRRSWIPSPRGNRAASLALNLPGLEMPIRAMALVLIVFSLLIGPINMHFVKRSKRPALLLLTVPAIALVFSIVLFAYGALAQGLDVRAQRQTFTLLDQRSHRSTAAEVRHVFAGLAPDALQPGAGASLWPEIGSGSWDEEARFFIDATSGLALGGDYMPVRTPVRQTLLTDRASRARVEVSREGNVYVVQNALGADMYAFAYRAADGRIWTLHEKVPDGSRAQLELSNPDVGDETVTGILAGRANGTKPALPNGTYAARLSSCAFVDHMGVEARDVDSTHWLVGILPSAEAP